jgi:hypothetical protein
MLNKTIIPQAWKNPIGFKNVVAGTKAMFHNNIIGHARNTPNISAMSRLKANNFAILSI